MTTARPAATSPAPSTTSVPPTTAPVSSTTSLAVSTTTTTEPPPLEPETFGWDPVEVTAAAESAAASLAVGPVGWLLGVSEDSFEAPTLWFSPTGADWERVAELPITRASIGPPVIGVGADAMVAIKIGDPEAAAFGEPSELAVWSSTDGATWVEGDPGGFTDSGYLYDLQHTFVGWLAVGESYRNQHDVVPAIYRSQDGMSWNRVFRGDRGGSARAIVERDGQVLVLGSHQSRPTVWRSGNGTRWRTARLPSEGHAGEVTAGAWLGDRWLVVGTGSETEPMSVWTSPDGADWKLAGRLLDTVETEPFASNRFGVGTVAGDALVVAARMLRFAHENFCFAGDPCFITVDSFLVSEDGSTWRELSTPPRSSRRGGGDLPELVASPEGMLASVTEHDGSIVVWTRTGIAGAAPLEGDPRVPELTIDRAESGQDLEPGVPYAWFLGTHCGIDQLGKFNDKVWQLDEPAPVPPGVGGYGGIYGIIELTDGADGQTITFTSGDVVVGVYEPKPLSARRLCY